MNRRSRAWTGAWAVYLPAAAALLVVVAMGVASQLVGFVHPSVPIEGGDFLAVAPADSGALAADLTGRLHWSVAHTSWWIVQVAIFVALLRLLWADTAACAGRGQRLRRAVLIGAPVLGGAMLVAGWLGVAFPGPLAVALQAIPQGATGAVVASAAVLVNAGASAVVLVLAFAFSALVARAQGTDWSASVRFDQLLCLGALSLAMTTLEVGLGYRWAAALVAAPAGELAHAVAVGQTRVIGGACSVSLAAIAFAAMPAVAPAAASVAHGLMRALLVMLPLLAAIACCA